MTREPIVAGQFYPGQKSGLMQSLRKLVPKGSAEPAKGLVSPHAGYIYSGAIAGQVFASSSLPDKIVILGPNHHGFGHPGAVFARGSWRTPLSETQIDEELAGQLIDRCSLLEDDSVAHAREHSIEVQLPFIQFLAPQATIVPICIGHHNLDDLMMIGRCIAEVLAQIPEDVLLVASTDMSHYESAHNARKKDLLAIDMIRGLDPEGLYQVVSDQRISMCGVMPVVSMLEATRLLGANSAELLCYGTSGDVTGDETEVVGYAGLTVK
ncbi:MAG: AmmeMemoRadiSam system protein B [Desulfuromonadales bacterium]